MRRRNGGIRKRCGCPPKRWPKCGHPWHFNFKWNGVHHRFSLEREVGKISTKADAEAEADRIRTAIRNGAFRAEVRDAIPKLTFSEFAEIWRRRRGNQLVHPEHNDYRLATISRFVLPTTNQPFGQKNVQAVTTDDIEAFREFRRGRGLSTVTVNHDLKLLRKMFNWGIRKGYLERTPFKIGTEPAVTLEREIPRDRRFEDEDQESRLLAAANPHLRAVIVALLDTACRPGEILSVQWKDVNLQRREMTVRAEKSKTRTARLIPISNRLLAVIQMRRLDPAGEEFPPDAYVFGDQIGRRVKSVRTAWKNAANAAGLQGFQLRDLRHESGSRFDEAGVPITYVSKILGHTNLTTTSRYLNIHRRGLQAAMQKLESHLPAVAQPLHITPSHAQAVVPTSQRRINRNSQ